MSQLAGSANLLPSITTSCINEGNKRRTAPVLTDMGNSRLTYKGLNPSARSYGYWSKRDGSDSTFIP